MTDAWEDLATYRQRQYQKHYLYLTKGVQVNPKAYCCDDNTINTQKPPVAILTVTPNPIFETEFARLDLTNSYDPDPAGIVKWTIWDGLGGAPYVRPPGANMFTDVQYNVGGRYEVIGVVEDGDGLQGQASTWIEVLSVGPPNPPEPAGDWRRSIYLATNVNGIYYTEDFSGPGPGDPEWATVNTGLGTTNTRAIVGDPWDPAGRQYTRTTEPKIYRRTGGNWSVILDSAIVAARTGRPVASDLAMIGPKCNINAEGHVYVLVSFHDGWIHGSWLYFFKSTDYGANWAAIVVGNRWLNLMNPRELLVGAFQGSSPYQAGYVIYAFYPTNAVGDSSMRVSVDQGATWGGQINIPWCGASVVLPHYYNRSPANQDTVYTVIRGTSVGPAWWMHMRKTVDRGGAWTNIFACLGVPPNPQILQRPNIYIWEPLSAFMAGGSAGLHWTENDWADYATYTNADNFDVDGCSRVMDSSEYLYGWRTTNPAAPPGMQHVIAVSDDRGQNWDGKAGNDPVTPSATSVPNNCGGVAGILQVWTEE